MEGQARTLQKVRRLAIVCQASPAPCLRLTWVSLTTCPAVVSFRFSKGKAPRHSPSDAHRSVVDITQKEVTWNSWVVSVPLQSGLVYLFRITPGAAMPEPLRSGDFYSGGVMGIDDPSGSYLTCFDMVFRTYVSFTVWSLVDVLEDTKPPIGCVSGKVYDIEDKKLEGKMWFLRCKFYVQIVIA
ncbi:MAG: hypothetical protein U0586_11180 [Candidatus Brocadiaceae bacterium]